MKSPWPCPSVKCYNPAFDVTDHTLITGIVTEKGICCPALHREHRRPLCGREGRNLTTNRDIRQKNYKEES